MSKAGLEEAPGEPLPSTDADGRPGELAADLERLGPTFIKLGQLLSTRADLLPPPYLEALSRLQDKVEPFSFAEVERIVEEELGVRISKALRAFDAEPIAAASLGQVHRAALRDGRQVAVKVQRPGIREQAWRGPRRRSPRSPSFSTSTPTRAASSTSRRWSTSSARRCSQELDYRREAQNLVTHRREPRASSRASSCPQPVDDYTQRPRAHDGYVAGAARSRRSTPLIAAWRSTATALAEELFRAYLQQILVDGFFHADPHPGNVFLTDDGRIALLDLGMVGPPVAAACRSSC